MTDAVKLAEEVATRISERAASYDERAEYPAEDFVDLQEAGLLGLMVPRRLGGMGAGFEEYVQVAMVLAAAGASTALIFNMHASVTGGLASVTDEMAAAMGAPPSFPEARDRVLRAAADGSVYGVAISEPEAGSRLSELRSTFEPEDGGYRIRGHKSAVSGAGHLDVYLVAARRVDGDASSLSYFLVPAGDGLYVERTWNPLGMRATASNGMRIDARVPREALLGGVEGLVLPLAHAMPQWLVASYAAVYVGLARAAVAEAASYLRSRSVAGRRGGLTGLPAVRARLGRAEALTEAARETVEHAARLVDVQPGSPETNRWVYRAKLLAGDVAMEVAASMAEACGLGALRRGAPLERIFRDARSGALMPPPSDVCAELLGAVAVGEEVTPW